jgi:hypothetical protein
MIAATGSASVLTSHHLSIPAKSSRSSILFKILFILELNVDPDEELYLDRLVIFCLVQIQAMVELFYYKVLLAQLY